MWKAIVSLARRLANEHSSPARLGWAVGIGVLIGVSPFYGFHLALCIVAATVLRLNRVVTYLAANISVPIIAPFLVLGSVQLGSYALHGEWLPLDVDTLAGIDLWQFGSAWLIGSMLVGIGLGTPAGLTTFIAVGLSRRGQTIEPDPIGDAMAAVATRYDPISRFAAGYVRGKFEHDPVYRQIAERLPLPSPIVDIGCGRGQTALLIAELQPEVEVIGFDWAGTKIEQARTAGAGTAGLSFEEADVRSAELPRAGTIMMIDVLHYNSRETQDRMLERAASALQPGGRLLIRELDSAAGWRAWTTRMQERVGWWFGLNRGATLCFRPAQELIAVLEGAGLRAEQVDSSADLPLANVLIEAHRR